MSDLLPCPFCGSKPLPAKHDHARMYVIRCLNCNVELWDTNDGWGELQFVQMFNSAWNRRALPAVQPVTVDELAQIIRIVDGNHSLGAGELAERILSALALPAVQPGHVNETPKSEHDAVNMLTLTAERDRYRKALEDIIADCEATYPPSHGAIKYATKLALKGETP